VETIGSNLVIILDGHDIQHNNAAAAKKGTVLSIENVTMHVLAKGNVYDMRERKFYASKEALPIPPSPTVAAKAAATAG
jgi:cyanophycinase